MQPRTAPLSLSLPFGLLLPLAACAPGGAGAGPTPRTLVLETGSLPLDGIFRSMEGPFQRVPMGFDQLDCVTAIKTEVVDEATDEPLGEEFFCHSQVQLPNGYRPLVMATGISEIRFPTGFGMPLRQIVESATGEERLPTLTFLGMLLNNHEPDIDRRARVRATIEYLTLEDIGEPPSVKRLYRLELPMTVEDIENVEAVHCEEGEDGLALCVLVDGRPNHWMVPPGEQVTRKRYSGFSEFDTTVHYGVVHLHNHGIYMRLTDLTTGEVLWQTDVQYEDDRVQIAKIPVYDSVEGFRIYKDHEYEIEAFYDNTTEADVDAMAMMSLYHHPITAQGG